MADAASPRYTKADLRRAAHDQGTPIASRTITDWVSLGLLDHPQRRGLGRGRGTIATWSGQQLGLFLTLQQKRQETTRIATLCNIPVGTWLYFGPDYVPLAQARRALRTFGRTHEKASARATRETARLVNDQLVDTAASRADRTTLTEALVRATVGGTFDREDLLHAARAVFDPDRQDRNVGARNARPTPEAWVYAVEARLAGIDSLARPDDDDSFERARLLHQKNVATYHAGPPLLAPDPESGLIVRQVMWRSLINNACLDLLLTLGTFELARRSADDPEARHE